MDRGAATMSASVAEPGYVRDLEENLQLLLFGAEATADAKQVFLSTHIVAFHLRHVFWKRGVASRVELARLAAQRPALEPM